jgi:hypothetical protein
MSDANKVAKHKDARYSHKNKRLGNLKDKKDKKSKLRNTKFYGYTNTQQY